MHPNQMIGNRPNPHNIQRGDKAKVVDDSRIVIGKPYALDFTVHLGKVGIVTFIDHELISLRFDDGQTIAYWHSEVRPIENNKENNASGKD